MYFTKTDHKIERIKQQTDFHRRTWEYYQTNYSDGKYQKSSLADFSEKFYLAFKDNFTSEHGKWRAQSYLLSMKLF